MNLFSLFSPAMLGCLLTLPAVAFGGPFGSAPLWRNIPTVEAALGVSNYVWDGDSICFSNDQHAVRFYQGRRKFDVNGTAVWLNAPPTGTVTGGDWRLSSIDLDLLQIALLSLTATNPPPLKVMLDAGHGGEDDGASRKNPVIKEKDVTLAVTLKLGELLTARGIQVLYTRTNDVTLSLDARSDLAKKEQADLFVSIHANNAANADAAGVETYVLTPCGYAGTAQGSRIPGWQIGNRNDYHNTLLGFSIHSRLTALDQTIDRGLKRQSFAVLRETSCPAVLVETGFLSNREEALRLLDPVWREHCAQAIAEGVADYTKKVASLDKAVAEKRTRDAAANERWRLHLTAQASATNALAAANAASTNTQQVAAAEPVCPTLLTPEPGPDGNTLASAPATECTNTPLTALSGNDAASQEE